MLRTTERITAISVTDDIEKAREVLMTLDGQVVGEAVRHLSLACEQLYAATDEAQ